MQCPRCQQGNPREANFCLNCATRLKGPSPADPGVNDEVAGLRRALSEALEQQTATAGILRVISSSPTDVRPVFDAIAETAARLCESFDAAIYRPDGDRLVLVAHHGAIPLGPIGDFSIPFVRGTVAGQSMLSGRTVHVSDVQTEGDEFPQSSQHARQLGFRTILCVPLMREGVAIGSFSLRRTEVQLFTGRQVALLETFADQAVIAIENVRLFKELEARNADLTEALEQQTATAEVLRVIGSSPTDAQPVFEAIVRSARRLLSGFGGAVYRVAGAELHLAAYISTNPSGDAALRSSFPRPLAVFSPPGEAIRRRAPVVLTDIETDGWIPDDIRELIRKRGDRSGVWVPMMRSGMALGAIGVTRIEPASFGDEQIDLLKTFADQAVIAVENVRLFTELEEKNRALTEAHTQVSEALEQQTATGEILRVISQSPTDVQPVFEAIAESAARLCEAPDVSIFVREADQLRVAARHGPIPSDTALPLSRESGVGWAVLTGRTIHIADMQTERDRFPVSVQNARRLGFRTALNVPLIREGAAIGAISLRRAEAHLFAERQVALLETFAAQAVIAIENVRLFKELEVRNRDLTVALDQQTATAEVLKVMSRSTFDLQPVLDSLIENAARLCAARRGVIFRRDGNVYRGVAFYNASPDLVEFIKRHPVTPGRHTITARVALERRTIHVADLQADSEYSYVLRDVDPIRTELGVPMLRGEDILGVIILYKVEVQPFTDQEIALLQTFADQAVIAIENVRLFKELQARTAELTRSVGELTALGEVSQALSSTLDLETVLTTIVSRAVQLSRLDSGAVFEYDEPAEEFVHRAATEEGGDLAEARRASRIRKGEGVVGRTALTLEPEQVPDISVPGAYESRLRENLIESGIRAVLAVPMVRDDRLIGCLVVSRDRPGEFPAETIELLRTFATQSALAIQNARLYHEIADKSRQLQVASQHKSEFLANMSHELRTPLNAIIGFSEVLAQGMFGDINEKQTEYLHDILESGRHLLSLINDILDLSKIEAGRMELELSEFDLPQAIQNALTLVRERALRRGIALHHVIDDRVADIRADERKVKQVLLNLLSNAIKFTPEGGRIDVRAAPADGLIEVSVTDSGVGIAPADQEAVFEEFRQVGTADKKAEGTGLGLALSRKFIQLHGGKIWVQSEVGRGSTFTFTLPVRPWPAS
jgi:GAF domain-containing protein